MFFIELIAIDYAAYEAKINEIMKFDWLYLSCNHKFA